MGRTMLISCTQGLSSGLLYLFNVALFLIMKSSFQFKDCGLEIESMLVG